MTLVGQQAHGNSLTGARFSGEFCQAEVLAKLCRIVGWGKPKAYHGRS
jgi:hypothetical protein